jgi:hypothetical protein
VERSCGLIVWFVASVKVSSKRGLEFDSSIHGLKAAILVSYICHRVTVQPKQDLLRTERDANAS